jgi:hypothetical protein
MTHAIWVSALLLFGFGAFAYGAVVASAVRAWRARRQGVAAEGSPAAGFWEPDMAMAVLSLVWFVVNLALLVAGGATGRGPLLLESAKLTLSFAFPPTILHYHFFGHFHGRLDEGAPQERAGVARASRGQWAAILLVGAVAAVTVVISLGALYGVWPSPVASLGRTTSSILGVLFIAVFATAALSPAKAAKQRQPNPASALTARVLYVVSAALSLPLAVHVFSGWESPDAPLVLLQSMPLFFLVATSYHAERFQFFDLIVKRGLSLAVALGGFVLWFALMPGWIDRFASDDRRPWLMALAVLPLLWVLPLARTAIGRLVDRRLLGRRYSVEHGYAALVDQVLRAMQPAATEAQLAEEVSRAFSSFFSASVTLRIGVDAEGAPLAAGSLRVPVTSDGERLGELQLGPRAQQAPWLSEDLALVGILADVCGYQVVTTRLREREALQGQRAQALELLASRSRLQALRAQVNPHFLFNALNAIAGLIHRDPDLADRTVERLAEVFRYTLRQSENEWAPFGAELAFVRAYLDVEQARFGGRLMITWDTDRAPAHAHVPALALQTLVENAVKHGVSRARGPAVVAVSAWVDSSMLVIDVADTGAGFVPSTSMGRLPPSRETGRFGLRSLQERLAGYFGDRAALTWRREEGRTHVRLTLPLVEREAAS